MKFEMNIVFIKKIIVWNFRNGPNHLQIERITFSTVLQMAGTNHADTRSSSDKKRAIPHPKTDRPRFCRNKNPPESEKLLSEVVRQIRTTE